MKDIIFDDFQNSVEDSLLRHKSILDVLSKYNESSCRINRAITKAVTTCGCIQIDAQKQCSPKPDASLKEYKECLSDHLTGELCENCREVIEREMGNNLFYLTSLCNSLNLNLYDILLTENNKIQTLGNFTFR